MPSGFASLDTGFPNLKGMKNTDQQIKAVEDYLVQLLENLRYMLHNIGPENFNSTEVVNWLADTIEEPIRIALQDIEGTLIARIEIDEQSLSTLYAQTGVNDLGQSETLYSRINQTADGILTEVSKVTAITANEWAASTSYAVGAYVKVTTGSTAAYYRCNTAHTSSNSNKPGTAGGADYWYPIPAQNAMQSQINQTASDITTKVSTADLISTINQSSDHISSSVVNTASNQTLASYVTQTDQAIAARVTNADMQSAISQSASDIMLGVKGGYANEWTSGTTYYKNDVVKVTTTSGDTTTLAFYKDIYTGAASHVAADANKPGTTGGASYWTVVSDPNVQSVIDLNLDGISLSYSTNGGDIGDDKNTTYLKLNKDGVVIDGAKIQMGNVEANSLTANAINALRIEANQITTNNAKIQAAQIATINANQIVSGTVEAGDITAQQVVSSISIESPNIIGGTITGGHLISDDLTDHHRVEVYQGEVDFYEYNVSTLEYDLHSRIIDGDALGLKGLTVASEPGIPLRMETDGLILGGSILGNNLPTIAVGEEAENNNRMFIIKSLMGHSGFLTDIACTVTGNNAQIIVQLISPDGGSLLWELKDSGGSTITSGTEALTSSLNYQTVTFYTAYLAGARVDMSFEKNEFSGTGWVVMGGDVPGIYIYSSTGGWSMIAGV